MINRIKIKRSPRFINCDLKEIEFKPGLNIILGANTSGKSSLIEVIKGFNAFQDDFGKGSQNLLYTKMFQDDTLKKYKVEVEGKFCKLLSYKPESLKEQFDLSYIGTDLVTMINSKFQSRGEGRRHYHEFFVRYVEKNHSFTKDEIEHIKVDYEPEQLIIVADEPENSMAINMQFALFDWFLDFAKTYKDKLQIIIATHSIAAFKMANREDVNIIELNKNWIKNITRRIYE